MAELTPSDRIALLEAAEKLEHQSFLMDAASALGIPIEAILSFVPKAAHQKLDRVINLALEKSLKIALSVGKPGSTNRSHKKAHTAATVLSGAAGGFFGVPGFFVELPITTTVMIHSIIEIARSHGEDLTMPENALACLEVFGLGPGRDGTESIQGSYYATRAALSRATRELAARIVNGNLGKEAAQPVLSFLTRIAARFGVEATEKLAAQAVPIAGAIGGATVNLLFTTHFQRIAEGHFTVRELERRYGADVIQAEYKRPRI